MTANTAFVGLEWMACTAANTSGSIELLAPPLLQTARPRLCDAQIWRAALLERKMAVERAGTAANGITQRMCMMNVTGAGE